MSTRDQEVKQVVEGLALGVLAQDVEAVSSAKLQLELGFNHAWRRWPRAGQFRRLDSAQPGNQFWIGLRRSRRRRGVCAAWALDRWAAPYVLYEGWTVDECLGLLADERASADDWHHLGRLYVSTFKPEHVKYVGDRDR